MAIRFASRHLDASRTASHCGAACVATSGASRLLLHRDPHCVATRRDQLAAYCACDASRELVASRWGRGGAAVRRLVGPLTPLPNGSEFCCRTRLLTNPKRYRTLPHRIRGQQQFLVRSNARLMLPQQFSYSSTSGFDKIEEEGVRPR